MNFSSRSPRELRTKQRSNLSNTASQSIEKEEDHSLRDMVMKMREEMDQMKEALTEETRARYRVEGIISLCLLRFLKGLIF